MQIGAGRVIIVHDKGVRKGAREVLKCVLLFLVRFFCFPGDAKTENGASMVKDKRESKKGKWTGEKQTLASVDRIIGSVVAKNPRGPEFQQAGKEVLESRRP